MWCCMWPCSRESPGSSARKSTSAVPSHAHRVVAAICRRVQIESSLRPLRCHAYRTRHTGAAKAAIAVGILRQVLLVVILGVVEGRGGLDFRGDAVIARRGETILEHLARRQRLRALLLRCRI